MLKCCSNEISRRVSACRLTARHQLNVVASLELVALRVGDAVGAAAEARGVALAAGAVRPLRARALVRAAAELRVLAAAACAGVQI